MDSIFKWKKWKHITKLDPDKSNSPKLIDRVMNSGTDAIMVSGTQRITRKKVERLVDRLTGRGLPIIIEPANKKAVSFNVDYVFIPFVLNSNRKWWVLDAHVDWIINFKRNNEKIFWNRVMPEAYVVLNPDSAVARVTKSKTNISHEEILAYIEFADSFIKFPIIYIEYSGVYGNPEIVKIAHNNVRNARIFYGGGINSKEKAKEMSQYATIIVGNIVYQDINKFVDTVVS